MSGPLTYSVGADISKFDSAMSRARDLAAQRSAEMLKSFQSTATGINTAMSGIQGLGKLPAQFDAAKAGAIGLAATGAILLASYALVSSAIGQANTELDRLVKLGTDAERSGVGVNFFQGFTEAAEKAKLSTEQVQAALLKAGSVVTPKFEQQDPIKKQLNDLFETGYTGDFQSKGLADYNAASTNEQRIRAAVTAMQELRDLGLQLAAVDLGEKLFGTEVADRLRSGRLEIDAIAQGLDKTRDGLADQVSKAAEYRDRLSEAYTQIDNALGVSVNLASTGQDILNGWLATVEAIAAAARALDGVTTKIGEAKKASEDMMGALSTALGAQAINRYLFPNQGKTLYSADDPATTITPLKPPEPPRRPLEFFTRQDKPVRTSKPAAAPAETNDAVETYVNSLARSTAALKAEVDAIGKSNSEKQIAINLAKAQELATQNGLTLTNQQIAKIKETSAATVEYREKIEDVREQQENLRSIGSSVLGGLVSDARNGVTAMQALTNAVGRLFDRLADQSVNSLVDSLFGKSGSTSGGVLSSLFNSGKGVDVGLNFLKFADGGLINGPGTGTSDSILARVSHGEFVVNAQATKQFAPLLEAINSGKLPGFAVGGMIGNVSLPMPVAPSYSGGASASGGLSVTINEAPGGDKASARMGRGADGNPMMIVDMISRQQAADISAGRGPLSDLSPGARRLRG